MTIPPRLMHTTPFKQSIVPRVQPPKDSWWITSSREEFQEQAKAQEPRWRGAAVEGREP